MQAFVRCCSHQRRCRRAVVMAAGGLAAVRRASEAPL